jgi:tellurite methyltransferase
MRWEKYYIVHEKSDTSKLLLESEKYIEQKNGEALDIGTGTGRDIPFLLNKRFKVTALDVEQKSIAIIREKFSRENVIVVHTKMEDFEFVPRKYDFINAQFALFFMKQERIIKVLESIKDSLKPNGIFCGQILGCEDDWANLPNINTLEKKDIEQVFEGFKIRKFDEVKRKGLMAGGNKKFWHYFDLIIQAP